jgi:hypothetical protein
MKNLNSFAAFIFIILLSSQSWASSWAMEIGGKRSFANYILPGNNSFASNLGTAYDVSLIYKFSDSQDLRFKYEGTRYLLHYPATISGDDKAKEDRYELIYSNRMTNVRPYFGVGNGQSSFINLNGAAITMQNISSTYGVLGLELYGSVVGWAMSSIGAEILDSFGAFYKIGGFGKLRMQEGSLYVDIIGSFSMTDLEKNNVGQSFNELSLGLNIGRGF